MSQSDRIARKRVSATLTDPTRLPAVLTAQAYLEYKQFTAETMTVVEKAPESTYNHLTYPGQYVVFGVPQTLVPDCPPTFEVCAHTDARPNRQPSASSTFSAASGISAAEKAAVRTGAELTGDTRTLVDQMRRKQTRKDLVAINQSRYCCTQIIQ